VDIDPGKKDIFGIPQLRFHFRWGENELLMWEHSKQVMIDLFKAMGAEMWGMDDEPNRRERVCMRRGLPVWKRSEDVSDEHMGAGARCSESLYLRCQYFPVHGQNDDDADCAFTMRTCDNMLNNFKKGIHKRA